MQYESPLGGADTSAYVDPDQALGQQGSLVRAAAIENHQRELVNLIEAAGLTADRGDLTQVEQAVVALINAAVAAATLVAPGTLRVSAANTPESGEFLCNGQAISRTTYAALFAKIGTTFGPGNGVDTFNLPDARGRTLVCAGQGSGLTLRSLGQSLGVETVALTADQNGPHSHALLVNTDASPQAGGPNVARTENPSTGTLNTQSSGTGAPHENMQPSLVVNVFIHI